MHQLDVHAKHAVEVETPDKFPLRFEEAVAAKVILLHCGVVSRSPQLQLPSALHVPPFKQ